MRRAGRVGVCPQSAVLWGRLTCLEQLEFVGEMYGLPRQRARRRGEQLLGDLGLAEKTHKLAGTLSGGMQRRLNLALALVHDPEIVVLDEPEAGLDPQSRVQVREYIRGLGRRHTIILTTHNMDEADRLANRVAIIDHGELLVLDTPEALKQRLGHGDVVDITLAPEGADAGVDLPRLCAGLQSLVDDVRFDPAAHTLRLRRAARRRQAGGHLRRAAGARAAARGGQHPPQHPGRCLHPAHRPASARVGGNAMKLLGVFRTCLREQLRSPWDLLLSMAIAPFFLVLYWSFMSGGSTSYAVLVMDQDTGPCVTGEAGRSCASQAIDEMRRAAYQNGDPLLKVSVAGDRANAERNLRDREATALLIFPAGFSDAVRAAREGVAAQSASITLVGDLNNPYYAVAAVVASAAVDGYVRAATGQAGPLAWREEALGGSASRSEFESYVPGLLIIAVTMTMVSVAIAVTRQIEAGTVRRLRITRMTALDFLGGLCLFYMLVSAVSLALALWVAQALGFRSQGPLWLAAVICLLTSFSVIGIGFITACLSGTTAKATIVVNFPVLLLFFFSGAAGFPMPKLDLFAVGGRTIRVLDILPHTHAVTALNKVMSVGVGPGGVTFELVALAALSIAFFGVGVALFRRMHLLAG